MGHLRKNYPASFKARLVLEMLREEKSVSELASEHSVHPTQLHRWRKEAMENLPQLFARNEDWQPEKAAYESKIEELYTEIGRLTTRLTWLKKRASNGVGRAERIALLDWESRELPIVTRADLLGLNRSGLYYKPVPPPPEEVALKHRIDDIDAAWPFYGSRRITAHLQREGWRVNWRRPSRSTGFSSPPSCAGACDRPIRWSRRSLRPAPRRGG